MIRIMLIIALITGIAYAQSIAQMGHGMMRGGNSTKQGHMTDREHMSEQGHMMKQDEMMGSMTDLTQNMSSIMHQMTEIMGNSKSTDKMMSGERRYDMANIMKNMSGEMARMSEMMRTGSVSEKEIEVSSRKEESVADKISVESERIDVPVSGMTCAACSSRVQKALSVLKGVESAAVNLAAERATIFYNTDYTSADEFIKTIKGLGYGVTVSKIDIPIKGMTCAACVKRVQDKLASLEGVLSASVNIATEKATLEYIPLQTGMREFKTAVKDIGYDIVEAVKGEDIVEKEKTAREETYRKLRNKLFAGAALTVPLFILVFWGRIGLSAIIDIPKQANFFLQLIIQTPVQFWVGWQFYTGAIAAARHRTTNMNTLIAIGTSAAYIYSVPRSCPQFLR
jgi:copper ion binding protein